MNNVSLTGRITREPELKYTPQGTPVVVFTLAVERPYVKETTDFLPCVAWNSNAEFIGKYVKKGNLLEVTGTIQTRSYQTQQGETRVIIEVVLDSVKNLTPKPKEETPTPTPPQYQNQQYQAPNNHHQTPNNSQYQAPNNQQYTNDNDLPF